MSSSKRPAGGAAEGGSRKKGRRAGRAGGAGGGGGGSGGGGGGTGKAKVIAVYNYKGGCGKTTSCINLASVLCRDLGKNVLLVDCDPQCNLTSFLYPDPDGRVIPDLDEETENEIDEAAGEDSQPWSASAGVLPEVQSTRLHPTATEAVDPEMIKEGRETHRPHIYNFLKKLMAKGEVSEDLSKQNLDKLQRPDVFSKDSDSTKVFLIPGHPSIIRCETLLHEARASCELPVARYALRYLIDRAVEYHGIDYVLVDFGPSASPLNINWIASCDLILPPTFADYFNCSSLHGLLTSVLPNVVDYHKKRVRSQDDEMEDAARNCEVLDQDKSADMREKFKFKKPPKLLCSIVTNYKTKTPKKKKDAEAGDPDPQPQVVIASCKWVHSMRNIYADREILPEVKNMYLPSAKGTNKETMVVCLAGTFNQLQQLSHEKGVPVTQMDCERLKDMKQDDPNLAYLSDIKKNGAQAEKVREAFISLAKYIEAVDLDA
jgi:cellulose biosynthesis protein BcsQ